MAEDDSRASAARRRTFEKMATAAMELPAVKAATAKLEAAKRAEEERRALLPLGTWAEDQRGCPNAVLRSALFCAGKPPAQRKFFREHQLAPSLAPYEVKYTGPQLYQPDLDVWLELVHRCRGRALGTPVELPIRGVLRELGRPIGKSARDWLTSTFSLLRATALHVRWVVPKTGTHRGYIGGLVDALVYDETVGLWTIQLDPKIVALFAPDEHTWVQLDTRLQFGKSYLAKWLHGYFSSHRKPLPISVERLKELSGSSTTVLKKFRQNLRAALDEVESVERSRKRQFNWRIDRDDLVHVVRESGN